MLSPHTTIASAAYLSVSVTYPYLHPPTLVNFHNNNSIAALFPNSKSVVTLGVGCARCLHRQLAQALVWRVAAG